MEIDPGKQDYALSFFELTRNVRLYYVDYDPKDRNNYSESENKVLDLIKQFIIDTLSRNSNNGDGHLVANAIRHYITKGLNFDGIAYLSAKTDHDINICFFNPHDKLKLLAATRCSADGHLIVSMSPENDSGHHMRKTTYQEWIALDNYMRNYKNYYDPGHMFRLSTSTSR